MSVQLVYAKAQRASRTSVENSIVSAQIMVSNFSYHKRVEVHDDYGRKYPATFFRTESDNKELWKLVQTFPGIGLGLKFALMHEALGPYWLFWDNNNHQNYWLYLPSPHSGQSPCDIAIGANVLCWSAEIVPGASGAHLCGTIALRNLAYAKTVTIRYSVDGWRTYQNAAAQYAQMPNRIQNGEFWNFRIPLGNNQQASFAIQYTVLGGEYWDNNFGKNYNLTAQSPLSRE